MITEQVISEIYKKYKKPLKNESELNLDYFLDILKQNHNISRADGEIVINDLEEFNPFRRFLIRSLHAVLEFDKMVAFVTNNHILFLGKENNALRVHFKPENKKSLFSRLFGGD